MLNSYYIDCTYKNTRLKDAVYLVSSAHTDNINLTTNNNNYSVAVSGNVMQVNAKNVTLEENVSLDGRYAFERTVTFQVSGYKNNTSYGSWRYIVVETEDGAQFMVNLDFPSDVTYEFTLDGSSYYTSFTFHTFSNYPLLAISPKIEPNVINNECKFVVPEIESVQIAYFRDVRLTSENVLEVVGKMEKPDFLAASLSETYEGGEYIATVGLTLPLDGRSWHYQLEEFQQNLYFALVKPKGNNNGYFVGLSLGLQATHSIESQDTTSKINVSLRGRSDVPITELLDYDISKEVGTEWLDDIRFSECINSNNIAIYTLKKQVDKFGNETGLYKAYSGLTQYFESLGFNIIGEFGFSEATQFYTSRCSEPLCGIETTIPFTTKLDYNESSYLYSIRCECDWQVVDISSGFTTYPSSGAANQTYNFSIRNENQYDCNGVFAIKAGQTLQYFNVISKSLDFATPSGYTVDSTQHKLNFSLEESKGLYVQCPPPLEYNVGVNVVTITVPENRTPNSRDWNIILTLSGYSQIVSIFQYGRYETWERVDNQYVCLSGATYELLTLFTGTTPYNIVATDVTRQGSQISISGSCATTQYRWVVTTNTVLVDGKFYRVEKEQYSEDNGINWTDTGNTRIGSQVT